MKRTSASIAILTAHDASFQELGALSVIDKKRYADRHGYECVVVTSGFDTRRPAAWSKLLFLREHLTRYDWILWMDADLLIMNTACSIESLIDDAFDLVMGRFIMNPVFHDPESWHTIHTGCFLIKNTPWARWFLSVWYGQDQFRTVPLLEEKAFTWLHYSMRGVNERTKLLPLQTFCSLAPHAGIMEGRLRECIYRPGDFIMHFLLMSREKKLEAMRNVFMALHAPEDNYGNSILLRRERDPHEGVR